mgnify:CR=1 FL=1
MLTAVALPVRQAGDRWWPVPAGAAETDRGTSVNTLFGGPTHDDAPRDPAGASAARSGTAVRTLCRGERDNAEDAPGESARRRYCDRANTAQ